MDYSPATLESLSVDELSALYDQVRQALTTKIRVEKRKLEERLATLSVGLQEAGLVSQAQQLQTVTKRRRRYPIVQPKYRNPDNLSETWAGRGKQPKWLVAQLGAGKKIEDFLINPEHVSRSAARA